MNPSDSDPSLHQPSTAQSPSRVIHFRNVGPDVSQHDILLLASGFGPVEQAVMLKNKNQALLQFQDVQSAISFMQYYSTVQANIRGRNVYPQFSNHQGLTSTSGVVSGASGNTPNRILLVTIYNAMYPITVDILYQVFGSHGIVERIVIFNKTKGLQALIQYSNIQSAASAKEALHGQNIYTNGSCQLHIQFSNLQSELTVTANNDKSKDFTKPIQSIPAEPMVQPHMVQGYGMPMGSIMPGATDIYGQPMGQNPYGAAMGQAAMPGQFGAQGQGNSVLLVSNLPHDKVSCQGLFNLFSNYGNVLRIKFLHNKPDHALIQMGDYFQATNALQLKGLSLWGKQMDVGYSKHQYINSTNDPNDPNAADFTQSPLNRFKFSQGDKANQVYKQDMSPPGNLLHVSNLSNNLTQQSISDLFSPFGSVQNIKMFDYNGKKQAFVQFATPDNAAEALISLHNNAIDGKNLKIAFSKNKI